ncbi:hypothetical protein CC86DRAFT_20981 [Ophiobolus disseminans]|uniref:Uncharacterized protein n=1 Tax=Ophiobolus disseminans TaxID=1469910 RepID=A0A6A7A0G4_9PLEO|nr:hypothetical protein CC86DRAFT_20981 [Ophiobolus disseminans]
MKQQFSDTNYATTPSIIHRHPSSTTPPGHSTIQPTQSPIFTSGSALGIIHPPRRQATTLRLPRTPRFRPMGTQFIQRSLGHHVTLQVTSCTKDTACTLWDAWSLGCGDEI